MNDFTVKVRGITINAGDVIARMRSTPLITKDYWAEADALELAYINANIAPDFPDDFCDPDGEGPTAYALRRCALPNNGIAIFWAEGPAAYEFGAGFWTDIDGRLVELAD